MNSGDYTILVHENGDNRITQKNTIIELLLHHSAWEGMRGIICTHMHLEMVNKASKQASKQLKYGEHYLHT